MTNFIELHRLCTTQLTVVFCNWLYQATCYGPAWPLSGLQSLVLLCTLIDTNLCKPDDGHATPKHVDDVTSCRIKLSIVLCKDGLIK